MKLLNAFRMYMQIHFNEDVWEQTAYLFVVGDRFVQFKPEGKYQIISRQLLDDGYIYPGILVQLPQMDKENPNAMETKEDYDKVRLSFAVAFFTELTKPENLHILQSCIN